ncbi:MAG: hypothetical protein P4L53_14370 [Candidatus Obscuribacterales bacterium]|nr:hypothetical protein [Candidatus Obscuribacterales bacterium]
MILSSTQTKRFGADLNRQLASFARSASQLQRDLRHLKQNDVLEGLTKFVAAVNSRQEAFSTLMSLNAAIGSNVSEAERTKALIDLSDHKGGSAAYDFLEGETAIKKAVEGFDGNRVLLSRAASYSQVKAAEDAGDKALAKKLEENSWLFAGAHHALESLSRQAESIASAQWAIVHGQGLHFWQGRQKWFRYVGDDRPATYDCVAS